MILTFSVFSDTVCKETDPSMYTFKVKQKDTKRNVEDQF